MGLNDTTCYESLRGEDGFSPRCQQKSLTPVRNTTSDAGGHETTAGCNPEANHAMRNLAFTLLSNLKAIFGNNSIYTLEDVEFLNIPSIQSLRCGHVTVLLLGFPNWIALLCRPQT